MVRSSILHYGPLRETSNPYAPTTNRNVWVRLQINAQPQTQHLTDWYQHDFWTESNLDWFIWTILLSYVLKKIMLIFNRVINDRVYDLFDSSTSFINIDIDQQFIILVIIIIIQS